MSENINVIKRDGSKEEFKASKINKMLEWAVDGVSNVSASDIAVQAELQVSDGITSKDVHQILVKSAENLISLESPNYQIVASRLLNYQLRKDVWGGKNPPKLYDLILKNIEVGVYDKEILDLFSKDEINKFDEWIDHNRDFEFNYCGIKQLILKYLVKNRKTNIVYETPQFAFMLIAMISFASYSGKKRNSYIKRAYNYFSKRKPNLPTPLMAGVRTPVRQYSSCCLIDTEDSIDGLIASNGAMVKATSQRFGIGVNMGRIRAIGSEIRNGEVTHTGVIPFLKHIESAVKSCHQNGIRGGGATVNFPVWHYEIEDILQLKNNAGTDANRVRNLDYCIHFSKLFYERWLKKENITLFSPHEVEGLYEAFGTDEFDELYEKYEKDPSIKMKKVIPMRDLMTLFVKERSETQRIYLMNIDTVNKRGAWKKKVNMTNLCVAPETLILTKSGHQKISSLEGEDVEVFNGKQYSKTKVVKTGENQKLIKIVLDSGRSIECTEYHKFYVDKDNWVLSDDGHKPSDLIEMRARDLKQGDLVRVISRNHTNNYWYFSLESVSHIIDEGRYDDTYCVNEPLENKAVFNGILTGNCVEINHPVVPLKSLNDENGEIGICVLGAINLLEISSDSELEKTCDLLVRMLDNIIDYQTYFVPAAENFAKNKRSLGIGITNLAGLLAKNNLKYSDPEAPNFVDEWMEKIQFYLLKSSCELAKEVGKCNHFDQSVYSDGVLPIDKYEKNIDEVVTRKPSMPWEELRKDILQYGLRNCTVTALMPAESSSVIQSSTNGIEPIKNYIVYKGGKSDSVPVIAPHYHSWKNKYELAFDFKDNIGFINIQAALQKWVDMSISGNLYYNPEHYQKEKIPDTKVIKELFYAYKMGIKTLYYNMIYDQDDQSIKEEKPSCDSGACAI